MRILGSSLKPSWFFMGRARSRLHNIDRCATRSGPLSRTARRISNHKESSFLQTRNQPPQWHEEVNKASPSIVILRTITAYRLEKFYVDYKIINTISISISISLYIVLFPSTISFNPVSEGILSSIRSTPLTLAEKTNYISSKWFFKNLVSILWTIRVILLSVFISNIFTMLLKEERFRTAFKLTL